MLDAGGIGHARTATPEFSCAGFTWSGLWGSLEPPGTMTLHQVAPLEDRQHHLLQAPQPFVLAQTSVDQ